MLAYTISYCSAIIGHPYDPNDLKLIGRHFRAFTHIYSLAHDKQVIGQGSGYNVSSFPNFQKNVNQVIPDLVKQLFPWIKQEKIGFDDFRKSFTGRGIVYTTGGHHFNLAYHSIYCLRHILRSRLPVEVMYNGEHDLTSQQVTALEKISHVKAIDISSFYSKGGQDSVFEGWAIKPFAMLAR